MGLRKRLKPRLWPLYAMAGAFLFWASPTPATLVGGGALMLLGESIRLWATGHLHKNDSLTVTGPYAFLRHPLYVGSLLIVTGFAWMASSPICLALYVGFLLFFAGYYMPYKNRIEGARLESLYGDAFRRYAVAVPTLVPRLYAYTPLLADEAPESEWRSERFVDNNEIGTAAAVVVGAAGMVVRWAFV